MGIERVPPDPKPSREGTRICEWCDVEPADWDYEVDGVKKSFNFAGDYTPPPPPPETSEDRRRKIACYRGIVRDMRHKASRQARRMTWGERANVRQLLDDIAALEAAEEASRVEGSVTDAH
jgi:hypothetical protein